MAVGGTGQHVALAYIDLAALVHHFIPFEPINLYILDRDQTMAAGQTAWQLVLGQIERLNVVDSEQGAKWSDPRSALIPPSREILGKPVVSKAVSSTYGPLFFTEDQLAVEFATGYWGQAPVGAAFFGDILDSQQKEFGQAVQRITAGGGRVVIAGSLVGGTGAGCLPRLVEHLARAAEPPSLMAIAMLQWFSLAEGADDKDYHKASKRNAEMSSRQPSSLLYSRDRLRELAATVLLGHPSTRTIGRKRPWVGNTQQPAHHDLTIPHYAAVTASDYLFRKQPHAPGMFSVACPDHRDGLRLGQNIWVFNGNETKQPILQLGNLAQANLSFCEKMAWIVRYLEGPPQDKYTWFKSRLKVKALEGVLRSNDPPRVKSLTEGLRKLLDAKWSALTRLYRSDPSVFGTSPAPKVDTWEEQFSKDKLPPAHGIATLREWLADAMIASPATPAAISQAIITHRPFGVIAHAGSTHRCLPPTLGRVEETAFHAHAPGVLDPILPSDTEKLIAYEQVEPQSLPTTRTVEFFLEQLFSGRLGNAHENKTGREWVNRWQRLLLGLCAGRFRLVASPIDDGDVQLAPAPPQYCIVDQTEQVFGYTSEQTLLVPAMTADWSKLEKLSEVSDAETSEARRAVMGWFELLQLLASKAGRRETPGWMKFNGEWSTSLKNLNNPNPRFGLLGTTKVRVAWGTKDVRTLLLPSVTPRQPQDLDALLKFFDIPVKSIFVSELPAALSALVDETRCPEYIPFGVPDPTPRRVVWKSTLPDLAEALRFGFYLDSQEGPDGRTSPVALKIVAGNVDCIDVLDSYRDILVDFIEPLGGNVKNQQPRFPDFPVKLRYAGLIDLTARRSRSESTGGPASTGSFVYRFTVRGLHDEVVETVLQKDRPRNGTFLLWPKFCPQTRGTTSFKAYYAMVHSAQSDKSQYWFVGENHDGAAAADRADQARLNWSVHLASDPKAQPLYQISKRLITGGTPRLMAVVTDPSDHGSGLFHIELEPVKVVDGERWGVDFGTSSSVVAVAALSAGVSTQSTVIVPEGRFDQTLVLSLNEPKPLKGCSWFPTWDQNSPRTTKPLPFIPSQLLVTSRANSAALLHTEEPAYGHDIILDPGQELNPELLKPDRVLRDFKWIDSTNTEDIKRKRILRITYLVHLLGFSYTLRAGHSTDRLEAGLPPEVEAIFSLPLRMKARDGQFARDFAHDAKAVCELLHQLLGARFNAGFVWESHVGAPEHRALESVYAVADLGGGSLDMWGGIGSDPESEYADSYRFGGHDLLQQWIDPNATDREQQQIDLRRDFSTRRDKMTATEKAEMDKFQRGFFLLALEATSRWVAGLAKVAQRRSSAKSMVIRLSLLGMGWGLNQGTGDDGEAFAKEVGKRVRALLGEAGPDVEVDLQKSEVGTGRKTYLARMAARRSGESIEKLLQIKTAGFLGFNLEPRGESRSEDSQPISWHTPTPITLAGNTAQILFNQKDERAQPEPRLPKHEINSDDLNDLIRNMNLSVSGVPLQYTGLAPISLALEYLRLKPKTSYER
jgi:hypothetical protein